MTSGTTIWTEDYNAGSSPGYSNAMGPCWRTFRSSLAPLLASDYSDTFASGTFDGAAVNMRKLQISGRSGVESNAGVNYAPYAAPATGFDAGQFPYAIDMFRDPNCYRDVTVTAKIKPNSPANAPLQGLIVNGTVVGSGATRRITGYVILGNGGGITMTLARFRDAYDRAFDYIDHYPGFFGQTNPTVDGPYKGWDYTQVGAGHSPAGGRPAGNSENVYAAHYRYNSVTGATLLEWEIRGADGVDQSPGAWDYSRTLTGSDSIPPAGGYGVYLTYYGAALGASEVNNITVGQVRVECVNP